MNYWPRWISAIRKRTAALSLMQMGAYDRLLDHYYAEDGPLPGNLMECCRIAGAISKPEQEAVKSVLAKFFTLDAGLYRNERADEEILLAAPKIAAAKANGAKGGRRPATQRKPTGLPPGSAWDATGQAPHPHPQRNTKTEDGERAHPLASELESQEPTPAGAACRAIRLAGIPDVNPSHPDLILLLDAGVTAQTLADTAKVLVGKGRASFAYLLKTVEGQRRDAAAKAEIPPEPVTVPSKEAERTAAYLEAQRLTPEQKASADAARRMAMASIGRVAA